MEGIAPIEGGTDSSGLGTNCETTAPPPLFCFLCFKGGGGGGASLFHRRTLKVRLLSSTGEGVKTHPCFPTFVYIGVWTFTNNCSDRGGHRLFWVGYQLRNYSPPPLFCFLCFKGGGGASLFHRRTLKVRLLSSTGEGVKTHPCFPTFVYIGVWTFTNNLFTNNFYEVK